MKKLASILAIMLVAVLLVFTLVACGNSITGIELKKGTLEDTVEQGGTFDTSTAVVIVSYSNGTEVEVSASELTFGSVSTSATGTVALSISYGGFTITHNITVTAMSVDPSTVVSSIAVTAGTLPTKVAKDGTVDTSTAEVKATMGDGTVQTVDNSSVVFSAIDTSEVGTATMTITYSDVSCKYSIEVVADGTGLEDIVTLTVKSGTLANTIQYASTLTMPTLIATYGNGLVVEVTSDITVNGLDTSALGEQSITFTYGGVTTDATTVTVSADADQQAKIVSSISVVSGSIVTSIVEGDTLNTANLKVVVTFVNGTQITVGVDSLTVGSIDTSVASVTEKLSISYKGELNTVTIEHSIAITAQDTSEIAESISVTAGTLATKVAKDGTLDTSSAVVVVVFEDGHSEDDLTVSFSTIDTSTVGNVDLTVSFTDIYDNTVSCTHTVEVVADGTGLTDVSSIAISGLSKTADYDSTYSTSSLVVVATYGNGIVDTITSGYTVSTLDTMTLGEQTVTVTHTASGKTASITVTVSATAAQKASIATSIVVVDGTIGTSVVLNGTLSTSSAQIVVTYLDESTATLTSGFVVGTPVTSALGNSSITVTYTDTFGNVVTYTHNYTVVTQASTIMLESLTSELIEDFESNSTTTGDDETNENIGFIDTSSTVMYAGDDSQYHLRATASVSDTTGTLTYELKDIVKTITVTIVGESDYDLSDYVTIDSINATFDFTEAAIGKTFSITISIPESNIVSGFSVSDCTVTATVTVVDGYNVYEAYELSLYDNVNSFGSIADIWTEFKLEHFGEDWESLVYDNFVLQADISITADDIADGFIWSTSDEQYNNAAKLTDQTVEGSLKDMGDTGIYNRYVTNDEQVSIEGNYFTISTSSLPLMVVDRLATTGKGGEGVMAEGDSSNTIEPVTALFLNQYYESITAKSGSSVTWSNIAFYGNGQNDGDETTSGAITLCKNTTVSFTASNNIVNNFYIAYLFNREGDDTNVYENAGVYSTESANIEVYVLEKCKLYNSYNTMVYSTGGSNIMLIDSILSGAGGPAIIGASMTPDDSDNTLIFGVYVNVINSTVESYVSGSEPWFVDNGVTGQIATVKSSLTPYFNGENEYYPYNTYYDITNSAGQMNVRFVLLNTDNKGGGGYDEMLGSYMEFDTMAEYNTYVAGGCVNGTGGNYGLSFGSSVDAGYTQYGVYSGYACALSNGSFFQANNGASLQTLTQGAFYWGTGVDFVTLYDYSTGLGVVLDVIAQ